ncbi:carotenoid oxygenase family protein [Actinokineospora bangkokensis]|uniref:Dioxygenase n=1 Tax=Actinokineospora bangkokensis TaxID=1193682 RepID=A0A1Q9LPS7_9PSEU|nr:carotenoid oxygenase family protein [Actinokineospora bangkokensis]OLR94030.1 carotenoid oxygenase [Actinokineospora bangkokensis]
MGNPYLQGTYAPVHTERTEVDLAVTGTIPDHLDGRYLRNGPNPAAEVDPEAYHWFMGDGMVHGVRLRGGKAEWYRNRWVRTEADGGPRPARGTLGGLGANTNVIGHRGRTLALVEGGVANYELDDELATTGICDFDGTLRGGYTAHPLRDPATGELHAVSYFFGWGDRVRYTVVGADGRVRRELDIPVGGSPMMHNFSLTEKYVVLYDLPVTFDPATAVQASVPRALRAPARLVLSALIGRVRLPNPVAMAMSGAAAGNAGLPYRWNPRYPARVGLLPREGGASDVRWFDVAPSYVYHALNAYDSGDSVVLDVVRHDRTFDTDRHGPTEGPPVLDQWTFDTASGKVTQSTVDDRPQEFPRVDERLTGRRHRYGYSISFGSGGRADTLLKHDFQSGSQLRRHFPGAAIGEFTFQPRTPGAAEDDGVLMGFVTDPAADRTDLALLDAATLEPVATVHLPVRVPEGFHGNWVPGDRP